MNKYGYYLVEKTYVYKEVEAENLDQANGLIEEFMYSDDMDWGIGKMEVTFDYVGKVENV